MNANTLNSLLIDLINHSTHNDNLKDKLRNKINEWEKLEVKYKRLSDDYAYKYAQNEPYYENYGDTYEDTYPPVIFNEPKKPRKFSDYNIFIKKTMKELKEKELKEKRHTKHLTIAQLFTAASRAWNDKLAEESRKAKALKENILEEITTKVIIVA